MIIERLRSLSPSSINSKGSFGGPGTPRRSIGQTKVLLIDHAKPAMLALLKYLRIPSLTKLGAMADGSITSSVGLRFRCGVVQYRLQQQVTLTPDDSTKIHTDSVGWSITVQTIEIQWKAARTSRKESSLASPPSRAHESSVPPNDNASGLARPDPFSNLMMLYRLLPLTCTLAHLYRTRLCLSHGGLLILNADSFTLHCTCCLR